MPVRLTFTFEAACSRLLFGEIDTYHSIGLGHSDIDDTVFPKGPPGSDKHSAAAGRWDKCRCVSIAKRVQCGTKAECRRAPAIFGKNHDIGVVTLQRLGNSGEPGSATLSDVPSD